MKQSQEKNVVFLIVRTKSLSGIDGCTHDNNTKIRELLNESNECIEDNQLFKELDDIIKMCFKAESLDDRMTLAWLFMIANVAQNSGKVKVRFPAPKIPGNIDSPFLSRVKNSLMSIMNLILILMLMFRQG